LRVVVRLRRFRHVGRRADWTTLRVAQLLVAHGHLQPVFSFGLRVLRRLGFHLLRLLGPVRVLDYHRVITWYHTWLAIPGAVCQSPGLRSQSSASERLR